MPRGGNPAGDLLLALGHSLFDATRHVVFGGGAMLGTMYIGALQALCGHDPARYRAWAGRLRHSAGTSAGAILAFLVAAGVDPWTMKDLLDRHDVGGVLGDVRTPDASQIFARGSLSSGSTLDTLLKRVVAEVMGGDQGCTLAQFAAQRSVGLVITVTNAATGAAEFWTASSQPAVPVWVALRASAAVPGLFPAVRWRGTRFHDGGITCNVPCHLFPPATTLVLMVHVGPAPCSAPADAADADADADYADAGAQVADAGAGAGAGARPCADAEAGPARIDGVDVAAGARVRLKEVPASVRPRPSLSCLTPEAIAQQLTTAASTALRIVQWYMCAAQLGPMRAMPALVDHCVPCVPVTSAAILGRTGAFAFDAAPQAAEALLNDGAHSVVGVLGRTVLLAVLLCMALKRRRA